MLFQTFHVKETICHQVSLAQHARPHDNCLTPYPYDLYLIFENLSLKNQV